MISVHQRHAGQTDRQHTVALPAHAMARVKSFQVLGFQFLRFLIFFYFLE